MRVCMHTSTRSDGCALRQIPPANHAPNTHKIFSQTGYLQRLSAFLWCSRQISGMVIGLKWRKMLRGKHERELLFIPKSGNLLRLLPFPALVGAEDRKLMCLMESTPQSIRGLFHLFRSLWALEWPNGFLYIVGNKVPPEQKRVPGRLRSCSLLHASGQILRTNLPHGEWFIVGGEG